DAERGLLVEVLAEQLARRDLRQPNFFHDPFCLRPFAGAGRAEEDDKRACHTFTSQSLCECCKNKQEDCTRSCGADNSQLRPASEQARLKHLRLVRIEGFAAVQTATHAILLKLV